MTKVAAIQMCSSHLVEENLSIANHFIAEAAQQDAKLVVLPEMFAVMGLTPIDKVAEKEIFRNGKIQSFLSNQAKNNNVWIIGGTIPIECDNRQKIRAASLVFDNAGNLVSRYDKIHLFDVTLSENE